MKKNHSNEIINAEKIFRGNCREAQKLISDPGKVDKLLKRLERKLRNIHGLGNTLSRIPQMGMLINSYFRKEYTEIPVGIITAVIGVLIYFVSPIDAIPDFLPGGYLDDAAVTAGALRLMKSDLDEYMAWRVSVGLDDEEFIAPADAVLE